MGNSSKEKTRKEIGGPLCWNSFGIICDISSLQKIWSNSGRKTSTIQSCTFPFERYIEGISVCISRLLVLTYWREKNNFVDIPPEWQDAASQIHWIFWRALRSGRIWDYRYLWNWGSKCPASPNHSEWEIIWDQIIKKILNLNFEGIFECIPLLNPPIWCDHPSTLDAPRCAFTDNMHLVPMASA